jgi:RNA polymerase sigma-70 factor (ECF subfamily)
LRAHGQVDTIRTLFRPILVETVGNVLNYRPPRTDFEALLLTHLDFLLGLAVHLTGDRDSAEDLVQESVLKACRAFSRFRPQSNFRAWVARILTNTFLTDKERARRWVEGVDMDAIPDANSIGTGEVNTSVTRVEDIPTDALGDEVMAALNELTGGIAVAVYLADAAGLSYARISRGRQFLQQRLLGLAIDRGLIQGEGS